MCFFRKKNRSFSLNSLLGFDSKKIDFESIFPFESYATSSLAVSTGKSHTPKLMLLNDSSGTHDPAFNILLEGKLAELQWAIQEQGASVVIEPAWIRALPTGDDFIFQHANTGMSDVLDLVFQSNVRQRRPVLVHVERSALIREKPSRLSALIVRDAFFNVNFLSFLGHHGEMAKQVAHRLLYAGRVAYLGFEMDDFRILARKKHIELGESVTSLLSDQARLRKNYLRLSDDVPLIE